MVDTHDSSYDHLVKLLLIGDSGVGKSSLLLRFTDDDYTDGMSPTIGVDYKQRIMSHAGKRLRLTLWDTAGQERFRTLTASYYRGAHGIVFVYDITRRESFANLSEVWLREVTMYCTVPDAVRLVVGNNTDLDAQRAVTRAEGIAFARQHGCLFLEVSAKSRLNVKEAFTELVSRICESPTLLEDEPAGRGVRLERGVGGTISSICSC